MFGLIRPTAALARRRTTGRPLHCLVKQSQLHWRTSKLGSECHPEIAAVFENLNDEELRRRANERLSDRVVAALKVHGERRSVAAGEAPYRGVASAVGQGSVVVQAIHARLASLRQAEAREPVTL
jgi:hypothetical protein